MGRISDSLEIGWSRYSACGSAQPITARGDPGLEKNRMGCDIVLRVPVQISCARPYSTAQSGLLLSQAYQIRPAPALLARLNLDR
jgi:hypothetical protein